AKCEAYFCGEHRLSHGCSSEMQSKSEGLRCPSNTPLRPFLCAFNECHNSEAIRIECPYCQQIFCLRHRIAEDHECKYLEHKTNVKENQSRWTELREKIEANAAACMTHDGNTADVLKTESAPTKVINEKVRKRVDQIAIMKFKAMQKNITISPDEQMFLFVNDQKKERKVVLVSKRWTVGRCIDQIVADLKLKRVSDTEKPKAYRMFPLDKTTEALDNASFIGTQLDDRSDVLID
ncbi:hypothetical protein AB6A40_010839, partial [Gnathostoma spinigerum]